MRGTKTIEPVGIGAMTEPLPNRSGQLTDEQLFGGEVPLVCCGYLPDDVRRKLQLRDVKVTVCPTHQVPCPALNVHTGECEASTCCVETQRVGESQQV
jgi:hypothetical protein